LYPHFIGPFHSKPSLSIDLDSNPYSHNMSRANSSHPGDNYSIVGRVLEEIDQLPSRQNPSLQTLVDQVAELEQELRNVEFRSQFLSIQRNDILDALETARQCLARHSNKK
jgi:hypothetical protein